MRIRVTTTFAFVTLLFLTVTGSASAAEGIEVHDCAVRFAAEVDVPALATGQVAEVNVAPNDTIQLGSPIGRLDGRSLLIRRRAAQLQYDNAKTDSEDDVEVQYAIVAKAEAEAELDLSRSIQRDARGAVPLTRMRQLRLAVERGQLEVAQAEETTQTRRSRSRSARSRSGRDRRSTAQSACGKPDWWSGVGYRSGNR